MKRFIKYLVFAFALMACFNNNVFASNTKLYISENGAEYAQAYINKDNFKYEGKIAYNIIGDFTFYQTPDIFNVPDVNKVFVTSRYDPIISQPDRWWASIYMCKVSHGGIYFLGASEAIIAFTDSLESVFTPDEKNEFEALFGGTTQCEVLKVQGVPIENQVQYCSYYNDKVREITTIYDKYTETRSSKYRSEYKKELETLKLACTQALSTASYSDSCVNACLSYDADKVYWDNLFGVDSPRGECGFSARLIAWITNIFGWIRYIIPVLVIIIGIVDFIKAVGSSKEEDMKKAQSRFIKRVIAAALIFIIPSLIIFVLEKMGFVVKGCGIIGV